MFTPIGNELPDNTFHMDFKIAERFGKNAILDTFNRASKEWLHNVEMFAALSFALNMLCWEAYENGQKSLSGIYSDLFYKSQDMAEQHYTGDEAHFYWSVLD